MPSESKCVVYSDYIATQHSWVTTANAVALHYGAPSVRH